MSMRAFELDDILGPFVEHCSEHLGLRKLPHIHLTNRLLGTGDQPTFAYYDHEEDSITISVRGRHIVDVLRSLAHELCHARQKHEGRLGPASGETGSGEENEANAVAGVIMRDFSRLHPEIMG
jgi:hypothetical protein